MKLPSGRKNKLYVIVKRNNNLYDTFVRSSVLYSIVWGRCRIYLISVLFISNVAHQINQTNSLPKGTDGTENDRITRRKISPANEKFTIRTLVLSMCHSGSVDQTLRVGGSIIWTGLTETLVLCWLYGWVTIFRKQKDLQYTEIIEHQATTD